MMRRWNTYFTFFLAYFFYDSVILPGNAAHYPNPDSISANPDAPRLTNSIVSSGIVQLGDKERNWYKNPSYITDFAPVSAEKLRRRFIQLLNEKYGDQAKHK